MAPASGNDCTSNFETSMPIQTLHGRKSNSSSNSNYASMLEGDNRPSGNTHRWQQGRGNSSQQSAGFTLEARMSTAGFGGSRLYVPVHAACMAEVPRKAGWR